MTEMQAIAITTPGGPDALELTTLPRPVPGPGEVLIRVAAAGVNRPDILQRKGFYPPPPGASPLPGLEVAGTVEALGPAAVGEVGQRVMALIPGGGYAEYVVVHYRHILPIPSGLSFEKAAALPETAYTVWTNVFEDGALSKGETILVHGATSGIGTMTLSLGHAFGAKVLGTAGSEEKCRVAERLGFFTCYNYREEDWSKLICDEGGVDVVLDMVGGDYVARNLACLRQGGRHISIAFQSGMEGVVSIPMIMQKRLIITGSTLRARDDEEKARLTDQIRQHVLPKIASGEVAPVIDRTFALKDAAAAHQHMENGDHHGKIVLIV